MSRPASIALLGLVLAAGGCATVPPTQVKQFDEAQLIVDGTIAHYGLRRVRLFVGDVPPNASARFATRQNWIILADDVLIEFADDLTRGEVIERSGRGFRGRR